MPVPDFREPESQFKIIASCLQWVLVQSTEHSFEEIDNAKRERGGRILRTRSIGMERFFIFQFWTSPKGQPLEIRPILPPSLT
jgi:hypothetical protein